MAPAQTIASILSLPDVQDAIFLRNGLTRRDLVNCLCVSHAWLVAVMPYTWHHTVIGLRYGQCKATKTALLTYAQWIRKLSTNRQDAMTWLSEVNDKDLCHLESLDFRATSSLEHHKVEFTRALIKMTGLQHFIFRCQSWPNWTFAELVPGLATLTALSSTRLQTLDLEQVNMNTTEDDLAVFLEQHGPFLRKLRLSSVIFLPGMFSTLSTSKVLFGRLESITWEDVSSRNDTNGRSKIEEGHDTAEGFRQLMAPAFASANLVDCTVSTQFPEVILALSDALKACVRKQSPPIQSFRLRFLDDDRLLALDRPMAEVFIGLRSVTESLTVLELLNVSFSTLSCAALSRLGAFKSLRSALIHPCVKDMGISTLVQKILTESFRLERLKCGADSSLISARMKAGGIWVCEELKDLQIGFLITDSLAFFPGQLFRRHFESESLEETIILDQCLYIFEQVSRLKNLETLHLNLEFLQWGWGPQVIQKVIESDEFLEGWAMMKNCQSLVSVLVTFSWDELIDTQKVQDQSWTMWSHLKKLVIKGRVKDRMHRVNFGEI